MASLTELSLKVLEAQREYEAAFEASGRNYTDPAVEAAFARFKAAQAAAENALNQAELGNNTQSAGATVSQDDAGATQDPAGAPAVLAPTGRIEPGSVEIGTNDPVRTITQTQSVPPSNPVGIDSNTDARPGGDPGVGAGNDDSGTRTNTQQIINQATSAITGKITPQPNVLDQYASYTYNIGWYLMPPDAYKNLLQSKKKNIASYQLLMQSGGAPVNQGGQQPSFTQNGQTDPADAAGPAASFNGENSGRNPFFPLDYYFDNLELVSKITGKGTNRAHNVATLKFTVTEPNGITLLDNLYRAVQDTYKNTNTPYVAAQYCLVIRFYGYDANGVPVQVGKDINSSTRPTAVVEKFIPFKISNITFRVSNRLVEYQVSGTAIPYSLAFATDLGTIKSNIEVTGGTVQEVMTAGKAPPASPSPDDGRQSNSVGAVFPAAPDDTNIGSNGGVGGLTVDESLVGA